MATPPDTKPLPAPTPQQPEVPIPNPDDHPEQDWPIDPTASAAPEATNMVQEDEDAQSQTVASAVSSSRADDFGLSDSDKVGSGAPDDDVPDLVDHMRGMVRSGQIDMDAYRGERNDDDEDGTLGPAADEE